MVEERDQRDIFRANLINLAEDKTYNLLITYLRNKKEKVDSIFQFNTLPS